MISKLALGMQLGGLCWPVPNPRSWGAVACGVRMTASAKALSDVPLIGNFTSCIFFPSHIRSISKWLSL